jgi:hypothetical protein
VEIAMLGTKNNNGAGRNGPVSMGNNGEEIWERMGKKCSSRMLDICCPMFFQEAHIAMRMLET